MFGWEFPPHHSGGLGVACYGLTRALSELGYELVFVMPKQLPVGAKWAKFVFADMPGVKAIGVHSFATPYGTGKGVVYGRDGAVVYGWDLYDEVVRYAGTGAEIARRENCDVIYAHDWLSFGAGIEAKRATGKPLVVHVHATEYDRCGGPEGVNPAVYAIEKEGMEVADAVIAVSEYTKNIIVR